MSIITETETNIITSFTIATGTGKVNWEKERLRGAYSYFTPVVENQKALVEKYYAYSGENAKECFSFSIIKGETEVVMDVTECLETQPVYKLLKQLFEQIEIKVKEKDYENKTALFSEITGSIKQ